MSYGEDVETILTTDGKEYFNVEVLKKNPTSLDISYYKTRDASHRSVTTIPFSQITEKYQKKYGYSKDLENRIEAKAKQASLKQNGEKITNKKLKEDILQYGKPVIVKSGGVYNLDGNISSQNNEVYKKTVFPGYNKYILENSRVYICDNSIDAKDYLKDLSKEISELRKELNPKLTEITETEYQIRLLNDRLTDLQKSQATRTYQSSSGTITVSYSQTEVNKCLQEIEEDKAKLKSLNDQPEIVSLISKINDKEIQYKNYSISLSKLEKTDSSLAYNAYFGAVVIVETSDGFGSGFFISKTGYIITNEHVVKDSTKVRIQRHNKASLTAYVVEVNKEKDLALLKADGSDFPCLEIEDTNNLQAGDDVIAIGTPKGLSWTVTKGIISAVRDEKGTGIIQTDVALNPGNSGGPLISVKTGKVVGVNKEIVRQSKEGLVLEGLNFAVAPSEILKAFPKLNVY
jgi:S1-C subfamily serine protease